MGRGAFVLFCNARARRISRLFFLRELFGLFSLSLYAGRVYRTISASDFGMDTPSAWLAFLSGVPRDCAYLQDVAGKIYTFCRSFWETSIFFAFALEQTQKNVV